MIKRRLVKTKACRSCLEEEAALSWILQSAPGGPGANQAISLEGKTTQELRHFATSIPPSMEAVNVH